MQLNVAMVKDLHKLLEAGMLPAIDDKVIANGRTYSVTTYLPIVAQNVIGGVTLASDIDPAYGLTESVYGFSQDFEITDETDGIKTWKERE